MTINIQDKHLASCLTSELIDAGVKFSLRDMDKQRDVILAFLADLRKQYQAENMCDACCGTGTPVSGRPCMCRGTGKMSEAARYLREELQKLKNDDLDTKIAELTKQATAKNLAIDYLLEKIKSLDANYGLEVVRVNCPFCSFLGSSHGSMVVHFGNNHYEQMKDCPKPHQWVPAMEKKS